MAGPIPITPKLLRIRSPDRRFESNLDKPNSQNLLNRSFVIGVSKRLHTCPHYAVMSYPSTAGIDVKPTAREQ
jgi:hypothetical protein